MNYDIIFILGEKYFDHPLCGITILKRLLEKNGYKVGVIETPKKSSDITKLGKPNLFFGIGSGAIDSMLRNYTALKKERTWEKDKYKKELPDRAVTVYSNWVKENYKGTKLIIGGVEASLRRFTHYDYWDNKLRKSILMDTRADILVYGYGEKQILEIALRIKEEKSLEGIPGTCIRVKELPNDFIVLPSYDEVVKSKEKFCDMQNIISSNKNLAQKTDNFYILQYKFPKYLPSDLDEYYELPFKRDVPENMKGFEFSVVTHRGCIGNCNFCSLKLMSDEKIVSRSEESIIREIKYITTLPHFKGNIDDLGGPSANMYGMDCAKCTNNCIDCNKLNRSHSRLINLMKELRKIKNVKKIFVRSGVRYDLATDEYLNELKNHISGNLKIAPEHVGKETLKAMNKDKGNLDEFILRYKKLDCGGLSFYFMVAHPGTTQKEAEILAKKIKELKNSESIQIFTPTPMTYSTCMYYTELDPKTKKKIYVAKSFAEKKDQRRAIKFNQIKDFE